MDLMRFVELKKKGFIEIKRQGEATTLVARRYDSATGDELAPETIVLDLAEIVRQREQMVAELNKMATQIAAVDAMMAAVSEPPPAQ